MFAVVAGAVALLLLLFPTGHLPSREWRPLVWISAASIAVATVATALNPIRFEITPGIGLDNPLGLHGWDGILSAIIGAGAAVIFPAVVLTLISLVSRYRRGSSDEREQIKWLAYVAIADAAILIIGIGITPICSACESGAFSDIGFGIFFVILALGIPAAVGWVLSPWPCHRARPPPRSRGSSWPTWPPRPGWSFATSG